MTAKQKHYFSLILLFIASFAISFLVFGGKDKMQRFFIAQEVKEQNEAYEASLKTVEPEAEELKEEVSELPVDQLFELVEELNINELSDLDKAFLEEQNKEPALEESLNEVEAPEVLTEEVAEVVAEETSVDQSDSVAVPLEGDQKIVSAETFDYIVQEGDIWSSLAEKFSTTIEALQLLNPDLDLVAHLKISIPNRFKGWVYYTVQTGDTWYKIAEKIDSYSYQDLQYVNGLFLQNTNLIVGQEIILPSGKGF